ncbi:MAG: methyltransferase domain-containing protein [Pseudonocardiales bacterium]|nr:methyltransferase domain-containing protein [Pseudonocardiales bacterium]
MRASAVHRALEAEVAVARQRLGAAPRVLDVGGGSGVWAVPLARLGCVVTVVEPSPNALAALYRRVADAGVEQLVNPVQGDADSLADAVPAASAELVLGHGLLEVVEDPAQAVRALANATAPGGAVSVLVANRYAAVLVRALAGRLVQARRALDDPHGRLGTADPVLRRFDTEGLVALLAASGLGVELVQGDGVVADLVPGGVLEAHPGAAEALAEFELSAAGRAPLRDIASRLHALARRPAISG